MGVGDYMSIVFFWFVNYIIFYMKIITSMCLLLRYHYKRKHIFEVAAGFCYVVLFFIFKPNSPTSGDMLISLMIILIILVILQIEGRNKILSFLIVSLCIAIVELVAFMLLTLLFKIDLEILYNDYIFNISISIFSYLLVLIIFIILKFKKDKEFLYLEDSKKYVLILVTVFLVNLAFCIGPIIIIGLDYANNILVTIYIFSTSLIIFFSVFLFVWLYKSNESKKYYYNLTVLSDKFFEQQREYYKSILDKEVETKRFRHDIYNHLVCIKYLSKKERFKEMDDYLEELLSDVKVLKPEIVTGSDIVDIIVNEILTQNDYKDYSFKWDGVFMKDLALSSMDMCTIFSNLIKNAIEAVVKDQDTIKKYIHIKVNDSEQSTEIRIENSTSSHVISNLNDFTTSKRDENKHGYGLGNVIKCVNYNNGDIDIDRSSNCFAVSVKLNK